MKKVLLLFCLLGLVAVLTSYFQNYFAKNPVNFFISTTPKATINNHSFIVLVAKTLTEKEIGLSEKTSLPQDTGMLFPFDTAGYYSFWMKNMKFPIDIIYINKNKIVTIIENAAPPIANAAELRIYKPKTPADKVLEINSGLSKRYGFKLGDEVKINNLPK